MLQAWFCSQRSKIVDWTTEPKNITTSLQSQLPAADLPEVIHGKRQK